MAESPHSMTRQSMWESSERKGAASSDNECNASVNPVHDRIVEYTGREKEREGW